MTITINAPLAFSLLVGAVAERGEDTIVTECKYVVGGVPNCIVGVALASVLDADTLALMEDDDEPGHVSDRVNGNVIGSEPVRLFLAENGVTLTPGALDVWNKAQDEQDAQISWGAALESAAERLARVGNE